MSLCNVKPLKGVTFTIQQRTIQRTGIFFKAIHMNKVGFTKKIVLKTHDIPVVTLISNSGLRGY